MGHKADLIGSHGKFSETIAFWGCWDTKLINPNGHFVRNSIAFLMVQIQNFYLVFHGVYFPVFIKLNSSIKVLSITCNFLTLSLQQDPQGARQLQREHNGLHWIQRSLCNTPALWSSLPEIHLSPQLELAKGESEETRNGRGNQLFLFRPPFAKTSLARL